MLDGRVKNRAHLLNGLVDSMKDHCVWIPARISTSAFCHQHGLPILKRRGTIDGCAREACDSLRDKDLHPDQVVTQRRLWQVQGMDGPLQSCLKVNPNQVTKKRLDVYLDKGHNVTFHKLFAESGVITPHGTRRGKQGPAHLG